MELETFFIFKLLFILIPEDKGTGIINRGRERGLWNMVLYYLRT
jgi:hypothetical protein